MIEEFRVSGFRSLKDVTWRPGSLNVIIGPNGSGKSNLLRALEFISVSAQGDVARRMSSFGGIDALLWDGAVNEIAFRLSATLRDRSWHPSPPPVLREISFDVPVLYEINLTKSGRGFYLGNENLWQTNGTAGATIDHIRTTFAITALLNPYADAGLTELPQSLDESESVLSQVSGPIGGNPVINRFGRDAKTWAVFQEIAVGSDSAIRKPTVTRFESQIQTDGQNLITVLHTLYSGDREFKRTVNAAMSAAFGQDYEELIFPPASDQRIQLRVRWKSLKRETSAEDLSDGTLRFLFLITILANPMPPPLIAIDEPETGLHPSMLPIIAEYAVNASLKTQVVFTTHSDQFLDAFTETKPTTTVAKRENGETTLTTLDGEDLEFWLKSYTLGALYRSGELESGAIG